MNEQPGKANISRRWIVWLLCLAVLSFYEARVMGIFLSETVLSDSSLGVIRGEPGMEVFQNRIAGPFLVLGASKLTGLSFVVCHTLFDVGMIFLSNLIPFVLFRRVIADNLAVYALVLLNAAGFVAVHMNDRIWDFDVIDFNTMFLFAYAVFFDFPLWGLILLFLVELMNREVAGFIALWMVIDGSLSLLQKIDRSALIKMGAGGVMIVAGSIWTKFIREYLMKTVPQDTHPNRMFHGENFQIEKNLHELMRPSYMIYTLSGLLIILFVRYASYKPIPLLHAVKVGLLLAAFFVFLFIFAVMSETRVWIELVPFMVIMYMIPLGLARGYQGSPGPGEVDESSPQTPRQ